MVDSLDPTKVRMVPSYHVDEFMVAGLSPDMVKLSSYLNGSFETNLQGELAHIRFEKECADTMTKPLPLMKLSRSRVGTYGICGDMGGIHEGG